ncbi:MAG: phage tail tape measure protein [Flavobacterium sp.]
MPTPGGTITRKDIITDDALNFGKEYADNIEVAIEANHKLVESAKALNKVSNDYRKVQNQNDYIKIEKERVAALLDVKNAIKAEEEALKSAEKIKQEVLNTRKKELDVLNKEESLKKRTTTLTIEERVQNEANNRALREAAKIKLGLVGAYEKLNKQRDEAKKKLRDLIATEGASIQEIKKAQKEFDELAKKVKKADDAVDDFTKNVGNYPTLNKFAGGLKEIVAAFGLVAGIEGVINGIQDAYKTIKDFDQGIADLKAITGATGKELDYLRKNAIELGKDTKGGAVQVVEAYKLIASAKPELLENVESLNMVTKSVLTLSKASGMELPDAATALTDAMNQFNAPAEEASRYIDAVANGAKYGAAEIPQVTEALLKFGAVAAKSNISIEESTALIELLAEKGLKGAEAGTALRNVLLKISAPDALPKEAQKIISDLGISMDKLKDSSIPVQEKFEMLKPLLKDNSYLVKVFGVENAVAATNILSNTDRLKELTSKMGEYGTAQEQADIRMDTLQGRTEKLTSTYDSFILSLNEGRGIVSKFFTFFVDGAQLALESLIRLNTSWDELYGKAKEQGISSGKETFQNKFKAIFTPGISDEKEVVQQIKDSAEKLKTIYYNQLYKIEQEIADRGKSRGLNIFGLPSGRKLNEEKERLTKLFYEQRGIILSAQEKIKLLNSKEVADQNKKDTEIKKLSEDDLKAREKAAKERERLRKEELARLKKIDDDAFALWKFRKEQEIKIADEIRDNDKEAINDRINALVLGNQKEEELAKKTAAYKLRQISRYNDDVRNLSDKEIETLINGGDIKQKLSDAEVLVLEEYRAKKREIRKKENEETEKFQDDFFKKELEKFKSIGEQKKVEFEKQELEIIQKYKKGIISRAQYDEELKQLKAKAEKEIFDVQIKYLEQTMSAFAKTEEQKLALSTLIHNLRIEYERKQTGEIIKNNEEREKSIKDSNEKIAKLIGDNFNTIGNLYGINLDKTKLFFEGMIKGFDSTLEAGKSFFDAINEISQISFQMKISSIDAEMQKWDDYYSEQISQAGNNEYQKELIEKEAKKKRDELEKEKRKQQVKQAIFNKANAALNVGLNTAQAIMAIASTGGGTWYADFGISAATLTAIYSAIGAAQLAAVLATPIPKYEKGTQGKPHDGGPALVAEKRPEVILEPGKSPYVISSPTLLNLSKGTEVIPSIEEYQRNLNKDNFDKTLLEGLNKKLEYEKLVLLNFGNDKEILNEMRLTRKLLEKQKNNVNIKVEKVDIPHSIWASKNINWS